MSRRELDRRAFLGTVAGGAAASAALGVSRAAAAGARSEERTEAAGATTAAIAPERARSPQGFGAATLDEIPAAGAWIELDRAAGAANLATVRELAGGRPVMGVVKANAYGHGLIPTARLLVDSGVDQLMVITVDEAIALREHGIEVPVLNYGPFDPNAAEALVEHRIDQAIYTGEAFAGMATAAQAVGEPARVQIVFDTGLGRVGVNSARAVRFLEGLAALSEDADVWVVGAATALTEDTEFDRVQARQLVALAEYAARIWLRFNTRHCASSAAVFDFPESHLDMVRPGIALYGHYPNERTMNERRVDLVPVLSLRARVAYVKTLQPGETIGYHRAWTAERETRVATLPIGHSEGYPSRALAAGGAVEIGGRACPLIGGITSNHLEAAIPDGLEVAVGDVATLIAGGDAPLSGAGADPGQTAGGDAGRPSGAVPGEPWSPTAQQVGAWDGSGVYGTLMHLSPLLPRVIA